MSLITARGVWLFMLWPAPSRSFVIIVIISVVGLVSVGEIRSNLDMIPTVCCTILCGDDVRSTVGVNYLATRPVFSVAIPAGIPHTAAT